MFIVIAVCSFLKTMWETVGRLVAFIGIELHWKLLIDLLWFLLTCAIIVIYLWGTTTFTRKQIRMDYIIIIIIIMWFSCHILLLYV
jgi:hypothetical protein